MFKLIQIRFFVLAVLLIVPAMLSAQDSLGLRILLPEGNNWNKVREGETITFQLGSTLQDVEVTYGMKSPSELRMRLDPSGRFTWIPTAEVVHEEEVTRSIPVIFTVTDGVYTDSAAVEIIVRDVPPVRVQTASMPHIKGIELPVYPGWNLIDEGDSLIFTVGARTDNGSVRGIRFQLEQGEPSTIHFDSLGRFHWSPPHDFVDRLQQTRDKHIFIIAQDSYGNVVSEKVVLSVFHKNQKPSIKPLQPFYILLGTNNVYNITGDRVMDPDGDPIVFVTRPEDLPDGMSFTSSGKVSWSPTRRQFAELRRKPIQLPFFVQDQPAKDQTQGYLSVEASFEDMPPQITMVPSDTSITINENERLYLVIHLSDPNGDEDVDKFGFVSDDPRIKQEFLRENTPNQYEFIWTPGYDFITDSGITEEIDIRFFVIDKSSQSGEKTLRISVRDTEDLSKKDKEYYDLYRSVLISTLNLMDQLEENQKFLEKELRRAKKGKKRRTMLNIALGAITGFSPLIGQTDTQKTVSVIGGTTTTTLGTLEAKDVIGTSVSEIQEKQKINAELYNQYLSEGTSFARRYNSKLNRRDRNFTYDLEKLNKMLSSSKLTQLELDAGWENSRNINNRRIKSVFTEFDIVEDEN